MPGSICRFLLFAAGILAATPSSAQDGCPRDFGGLQAQLRDSPEKPQLSADPVTRFLPPTSDARIVVRDTLTKGSEAAPKTFRVFETTSMDVAGAKGALVPILSVQAPTETLFSRYRPDDSVVLRVLIAPTSTVQPEPAQGLWWNQRFFVVASCSNKQLDGWALANARVSSPGASLAICAAVALVTYLLAMTAVYVTRRSSHPLAAKYPAVFAARRIGLVDFLNPIQLTANAFNQGSVQKLQVLLFSFLVGWLVLGLVLQTGALADLSPTIVGLLGISGIGAATAQITYQQKTRLSFENWAWLDYRGVLKKPDPATQGPKWRDLVLTNREFDVYKLQTIVFSLAVAFALIGAGASNLSTFKVPETLLGILGLSQVVYIGGILVRPPAVSDLDDALTKLRAAGETLESAKLQNTDTGPDGKLLPTLPAGQAAAANAQRQYDQLADRIVPMIESTLEVQADRSKL